MLIKIVTFFIKSCLLFSTQFRPIVNVKLGILIFLTIALPQVLQLAEIGPIFRLYEFIVIHLKKITCTIKPVFHLLDYIAPGSKYTTCSFRHNIMYDLMLKYYLYIELYDLSVMNSILLH